MLYSKIPSEIKKEIISPYISVEDDEARISVRIKDSLENLRRNDLIEKINLDLSKKLGFGKEEYQLTGVLILFNNLLQSLFKSQILTLGIVMIGIIAMFFILFRNLNYWGRTKFYCSFFYSRNNWFSKYSFRYDDNYHCSYYNWNSS